MRIGSTRSESRTASRWSPSFIGPAVGATRPFARSMPSRRSWRRRRFPWSRRCRETAPLCTFIAGFRYAVFPRRGGRWPELATADEREWVGRFLGRIHAVGRAARVPRTARASASRSWAARHANSCSSSGLMPDYLADEICGPHRHAASRKSRRKRAIGAARARGASWATATAATSFGPISARISSISTIA